MAVSRGSCRGKVLWRPHMPHPMLVMPSHAISCTPIPPWSSSKMSQHSQHQSTARIRVPSGLFGLAEQGLLFEHFFLFQKFRQGGNSWNLFDFDNQSAAFFCVETIKYCSIPTVPSGLEEFKTRPESPRSRVRSPECSPFVFCVPFFVSFFCYDRHHVWFHNRVPLQYQVCSI